MTKEKLSIAGLRAAKGRERKLRMVTAYDYPSALLVDRSPIELLLVGDSVGNTVLGYQGTAPVTLEEMLHHLRAVVRGAQQTLIVCDMPFGSYNVSSEQAVQNATALVKAGAECVKLEGGAAFAETVQALVRAGIPVMAHIGLMPQTVHPSDWKIQGRDTASARAIIADADALAEAGASALLLEAVPMQLAEHITERTPIPTIGIAAGPSCDGQVIVWHDLLGYSESPPRHVHPYASVGAVIADALERYADDVASAAFPAKEHSFSMKAETLAQAIAAAHRTGQDGR